MNSKILNNEYKINLDNKITIYYGSQNEKKSNIISITVKGKFKPTIDTKDYKPLIKIVKDDFNRHGNECISKIDWINKHYIFTTDFTECGLMLNKTCKWKFKMFIIPLEKKNIEEYRIHIIKLCEDMIGILEYYMNLNGFTMNN